MSTLISNTEFLRIQIDIRKTQGPDISSQQDPYLHLFLVFVRQRRYITIPEPENRQESGNNLRNPEPGNDWNRFSRGIRCSVNVPTEDESLPKLEFPRSYSVTRSCKHACNHFPELTQYENLPERQHEDPCSLGTVKVLPRPLGTKDIISFLETCQ